MSRDADTLCLLWNYFHRLSKTFFYECVTHTPDDDIEVSHTIGVLVIGRGLVGSIE